MNLFMALQKVATVHDVKGLEPLLINIEDIAIGIYKFNDEYYAYENICPHQGGPVCEGIVSGKAMCEVSPRGSRVREYASDDQMTVVCPWHGVEYDIETGTCLAFKELQLRSFKVVVDGENILVQL